MPRSYAQHCALAHALDIVGERWTLLIVRELLVGPRRYTDLARGLVTVPSNVLAERLRHLEDAGLIARRRLPDPAEQVVVYELTEEGAQLSDAVAELAKWGLRSLPTSLGGRVFRSRWLILAMEARFDPIAAAGVNECYELSIPGEEPVHFEVRDGHGAGRTGAAEDPAVRVQADAETLLALASGALAPEEAPRHGAVIEGTPASVARMLRILPPPAPFEHRDV
jgi:DNA-binding HxlR family transcriptional regulator